MTRSITQEMGQSTEDTVTTSEHGEIVNTELDDEPLSTEDAAKVITTDEELEAFARVQAIAATSLSFQHAAGYKDVESYFGVHVGKPGWWFMRFYLSPKRKSLVARLSTQETKALAPEFEVQEVSTALGGEASRVVIASIEDLDKLKALVLRCYEAEAGKHPVATRKDA